MAARRKPKKKPDAPAKVKHPHMQGPECSVLYVFSRWPGIVGPHDVRKLTSDGYVTDGKVNAVGRKRIEELGEVGPGYDGFGSAEATKADD